MTVHALLVLTLFVGCLLALAFPLGDYMARIYDGRAAITRWLAPIEGFLYRAARVDPAGEMGARTYLAAVLVFNLAGLLLVYAVLRLQAHLPLNPAALPGVLPEVAFNTAVSFASNTNWQAYAGETTLSPFSQMFALTVQNFLSAATGMAVLVALVRGFARNTASGVGNFWVDLTRGTLYVLLPLSAVLALVLVSQGVVQTFDVALHAQLLEPFRAPDGSTIHEQVIALGPVASQVAIKQLGTNGGGFFNANSAHPFENPTPLSNFAELLAIVLIPAALCITFGKLVGDRRQGIALLATMLLLFLPMAVVAIVAEQHGTPLLAQLTDLAGSELAPGGNMEGKELRFGIVESALWATATSAASNGSVNAMHDSFTPLGGLVPMFLIQLGEIVFGGVGSGLYGMLVYAIVAVFISGLMVGRTPEYLGKKIEAFEMKMASLVILLPAATVLLGTAMACLSPSAKGALGNPGPHGFSELLYAFSSAANNNGSAFGGLDASRPFYAIALGIAMLIGRYCVIVPVLAIAGALAKKRQVPVSSGTLPTHTPLFVGLLSGTILLVGALTFVPAIALGPVVEALILSSR
ncbi:MAG: Potassium-transporting ATPase chain [Pseudomonadota bacterium]